MKVLKSVIILTSAIGLYEVLKTYKNKKKPVRQKGIRTAKYNKFKNVPPAELKQQFKQRIAAGDWLSINEYEDMMKAIKKND